MNLAPLLLVFVACLIQIKAYAFSFDNKTINSGFNPDEVLEEIIRSPREHLTNLLNNNSLIKVGQNSVTFSYVSEFTCEGNGPGTLKVVAEQPNDEFLVESFSLSCGVNGFNFSLIRKGKALIKMTIDNWLKLKMPDIEKLDYFSLTSAKNNFRYIYSKQKGDRASLEVGLEVNRNDFFNFSMTQTGGETSFVRTYIIQGPAPAEGIRQTQFSYKNHKITQGLFSSSWWNADREISYLTYDKEFVQPTKERLKALLLN